MQHNWVFSDINEALPQLCRQIAKHGDEVGSRNGRAKELMHVGVTINRPARREILLPDRKANLAAQIAETMWVLAGRNDMEFLSHYLPRAKDYSDDGETWRAGYGPRLRGFESRRAGEDYAPVDQWAEVIRILREDPLSRRAAISIWDPAVDFQPGKDIPCNDLLVFSSRLGYLDLHVTIRSNDLVWGWSGINAFEWSAMLEITAKMLGLSIGRLHFSIVSLHVYEPHWAKMDRIADDRPIHTVGSLDSAAFNSGDRKVRTIEEWDDLAEKWFAIEKTIREDGVDQWDRWVIENFPDPMLRDWLRALQWWWSGDDVYLTSLHMNRLANAASLSIQPPDRTPEPEVCPKCGVGKVTNSGGRTPMKCIRASCNYVIGDPIEVEAPQVSFDDFVTNLHDEKHAAYGDSWKRRGEMLGILANIARKIDRLGTGASTSDETSADTAIDLLVYLCKYHTWLNLEDTGGTQAANAMIRWIGEGEMPGNPDHELVAILTNDFDQVEIHARDNASPEVKAARVLQMAYVAYALAQRRWVAERAGSLAEAMVEALGDDVDEYKGADAD